MLKCRKGFKKIDGRCTRNRSGRGSSRKKSYNPFKMWGSWMGLIFFSIPIIPFAQQKVCKTVYDLSNYPTRLCFENNSFFMSLMDMFTHHYIDLSVILIGKLAIYSVVGFLIGWIINSLWRKFR